VAAALACVGVLYLAGEGAHFGKQGGRLPWHSVMLLAPYLLAARLNVWAWTRRLPVGAEITPGIFLGRQPDANTIAHHKIRHVLDLCAELPRPARHIPGSDHPMLDLLRPTPQALQQAAHAIEQARHSGPVWVCCALGFSRSAQAALVWLMHYQQQSLQEALATLRQARPQVVLSAATLEMLATLEKRNGDCTCPTPPDLKPD
jgi:predicted protein tyrosine phosphatase